MFPKDVQLSRRALMGAGVGGVALGLIAPSASAAPASTTVVPGAVGRRPRLDPLLGRWARDTWRSMTAMAHPRTGLVADNIDGTLTTRSGYTSPTYIGGYLWCTIVARDLGLINPGECRRRIAAALATVSRMSVHPASGMYVNWYDEATGAVLRTWPENGDRVYPFYSSIDNAWLGAALWLVAQADPSNRKTARRLFDRMRWDMFYDTLASRPGGLMHGGFYDEPVPPEKSVFTGNHIGVGPDVWYTNHHYDTAVSETRITTYLGIMTGQVPAQAYYATWRTFPETDDWSWPEMKPVGVHRTYFGIDVFEVAYTYRGMRIVPGWGGSMFEELMPDLFVPEEDWAPRSWGVNHPLHVRAQREHGMVEAGYGYWGFSPASNPAGGYREYGVDARGMKPDGYFSDQENTDYDIGFGTVRPATNPHPTFGDGVVTPHAAFLAMMHERAAATENLVRIERNLHAYGPGGFYDAVATRSGRIARRYLSLDQAMILGAIGNVAGDGIVRRYFATSEVERALRPVIGIETFSAGV